MRSLPTGVECDDCARTEEMPPIHLSPTVVVVIAVLAAAAVWLAWSRQRLVTELLTTRSLFSKAMELAPFCAYMKDADGRYVYVNPALVELMRTDLPHVSSVLGRTDHEFIPPPFAQGYVDDDRQVLRQGKPLVFDEQSLAADGSVRRWCSVKFPWSDRMGRPCVAGMSINLSEAEDVLRAAKASEDRCALALEAGRMGTLTMDLATQMLETSPLFAVLHGRPESATRLSLADSLAEVHPDDRESIVAAVRAALRDQAPSRITYRVVKPGGGIAWIELTGQVYADEEGHPATVRGVAFDITERQRAFEELDRRRHSLRRLIEVQENERKMLCNELHDGVLQYLIGAIMLLEVARTKAESADQVDRMTEAIDSLNRGLVEGRHLIRGVRPAVLDDLGLEAAIHDLTDQMATFGIVVKVALDDGLDGLPVAMQTTVYRVVQESLANIRKHAETRQAEVEIRRTPLDVHVRVRDDGKGFDASAGARDGFGLTGMAERVQLAGGRCVVESRPGAGSQVDVRLPIREREPSSPDVDVPSSAGQERRDAAGLQG